MQYIQSHILFICIVIYIGITVLIGVLTSRLVKNSEDFVLAGRKLPLFLCISALFAEWFGAETVLGSSSQFAEKGLYGVIEEPFGAALCLLLIGIFFARPFYRMKLLTFCDFYRIKFGRSAELLSGFLMVPSYLGWIAAQLVALGIMFNIVMGVPLIAGIIISASIVLIYTYIGGMWAISVTDFIQTIIIIIGLVFLGVEIVNAAGGLTSVYQQTPDGFFKFFPDPKPLDILEYIAAWITIGLGSIPQQDVFQRVMSANSEKNAVRALSIGAVLYLSIAFLPLLIALCGKILYPEILKEGEQLIPTLVLKHTSVFMQVLFFGALISAILSTASGAILAPATVMAENLIKPLRKKTMTDKEMLRMLRLSVIVVTILATAMATSRSDIYELAGESSALSLVSLFVPLVAGLYIKSANTLGAILSMIMGLLAWILSEWVFHTEVPPLIIGLTCSFGGMFLGMLLGGKNSTMVNENNLV